MSTQTVDKPLIVIAGPTASGKSALAFRLALDLGGEIVSADSMQLYKGLDKGTAKPSLEEIRAVPHHLVNVLDLKERADVFSFVRMADAAIAGIRQRGRIPIIAGGTGLYIRALINGMDEMPTDSLIRERLEKDYGAEERFDELKRIMKEKAPDDFVRWEKHQRKLLRAYEVFVISGKSITSLQKVWNAEPDRYESIFFSLAPDREELKKTIHLRAAEMLRNGWIEETEALIANGLFSMPTAWQALGYSIVGDYLAGKLSYEKMHENISIATWQLARRQLTWFKTQHPGARRLSMPCDYDALYRELKDVFCS